MNDNELQAIRAKRMAEMQGQSAPNKEQQEEIKRQQDEFKNNILTQLLEKEARARLCTLALTKPEKVQMVENMLIQMAQRGQLTEKMTEAQLKQLLEQVSEKTQKATTVKFDRRRAALDSDDDY